MPRYRDTTASSKAPMACHVECLGQLVILTKLDTAAFIQLQGDVEALRQPRRRKQGERRRPLSLDKATSLLFICLKPDAISRMLLIIGDTGTSGTRAWVHRSPIHCAIKSFESLNSIRRW